jgi:tripartite-type tricarboxylate transporter receptor subunit TctC
MSMAAILYWHLGLRPQGDSVRRSDDPEEGAMQLHSLVLVFAALMISFPEPAAWAGEYPSRAITLISPWPPGATSDTHARMLGARLADRLGKPVLIENRPGAGSTIGVASAARAAPDGYTLVWAGTSPLTSAVTIYKKLPYDPTRDLTPIALVVGVPFVLVVHPSLPARTVPELVKLADEKPDQLSYASGGPGSPHHLLTELFKTTTNTRLLHIPYKGGAPAVTDVVAGHVPVMFADSVPVLPLIREGKLRALGVSTKTRLASAPDIPTLAEAGLPGFDVSLWAMVLAPAGTPKAIVDRLHSELKSVVELPAMQEEVLKIGLIPLTSPPPDELTRFIETEIARWAKVVHQAGIAGSQ